MKNVILAACLFAVGVAHAQSSANQTLVIHQASPAKVDSAIHLLGERPANTRTTSLRKGDLSAVACTTNSKSASRFDGVLRVTWNGRAVLGARIPTLYSATQTPIDDSLTNGDWQQLVGRVELAGSEPLEPVSRALVYVGVIEGFPHVVLPKGSSIGAPVECATASTHIVSVKATYPGKVGQIFILAYGKVREGLWWSLLGEANTPIRAEDLHAIARSIMVDY